MSRPILRLTPLQQEIYELVTRRPRTAAQLYGIVYQLRPQPPAISVIKATIYKINCKLCYRGERIMAGRDEPYKIVRIKPHGHPNRMVKNDGGTAKHKSFGNPHHAGVAGPQSAGSPRRDW
jgi:hypothetical protein